MPELRQDRFSKEWVIMATERARRPEDLALKREIQTLQRYEPGCPFCPGNESMTPPELMRVPGDGAGAWRVRVVPNKFAALSRDDSPDRHSCRLARTIGGFGIHDVIIETPNHGLTRAQMTVKEYARLLEVYRSRYREVSSDDRVRHVTIFKNHGVEAGTSLIHPHSQMIGTPVVSRHVRERLYDAMRHYDEFGECVFCEVMEEELAEQKRIVVASKRFVAVEAFASPSPFTTHIYPRRHMASFGGIRDDEIQDLAEALHTILTKLYVGLQDPDFNYVIRTAPEENAGVMYYHWHLSVIPRLTEIAGFELGSGMYINTVLPEAAAEFLRNVDISGAHGSLKVFSRGS